MKKLVKEENDLSEYLKIFERRNKIIYHNNMYIINTISYYDKLLLNEIIKPFFFNENYDKYPLVSRFITDKLNFMDKYMIVKKIAKMYKVKDFKKIDDFLQIRNQIAHNLTSVESIDLMTKGSKVKFANTNITWEEYLSKIKKWTEVSYEMAEFIRILYHELNNNKEKKEHDSIFVYCYLLNNCIIFERTFSDVTSYSKICEFAESILDPELINYEMEEMDYMKEK